MATVLTHLQANTSATAAKTSPAKRSARATFGVASSINLLKAASKAKHASHTVSQPQSSGSTAEPWKRLLREANPIKLADISEDSVSSIVYDQLHWCKGGLGQKPGKSPDFHVNVGRAIDTLREDIPCFFKRAGRYDIYTDDVAFLDNISPQLGLAAISTGPGKDNYRRLHWSVRFHAAIFFTNSKVDILRLWQRDEQSINVRWTVKCLPRLLNGVTGKCIYLDGVSEFKLNSDGRIYQHKVDIIDWAGLHFDIANVLARRREQLLVTPTCCSKS